MQLTSAKQASSGRPQRASIARTAGERGLRRKELQEDAEKRRRVLDDAIKSRGMTVTEAARAAGLRSSSSLFNFLGGQSRSMSYDTVAKLAAVFPDLPAAMLLGGVVSASATPGGHGPPASLAAELRQVHAGDVVQPMLPELLERGRSTPFTGGIMVCMEAQAGKRWPGGKLPVADTSFVGMPLGLEWAGKAAFGVQVKGPGAEQIYREGTILACVPMTGRMPELKPGWRVIVTSVRQRRGHGARTEVTVREIVAVGRRLELVLRGSSPDGDIAPEQLVFGHGGYAWESNGHDFRVVGLVVMACQPEITFLQLQSRNAKRIVGPADPVRVRR